MDVRQLFASTPQANFQEIANRPIAPYLQFENLGSPPHGTRTTVELAPGVGLLPRGRVEGSIPKMRGIAGHES